MSSVNSYLYNNYSNSYNTTAVQSTRNSKWRGGVTGWEPKVDNSKQPTASKASQKTSGYIASVKEAGVNLSNALSSLKGTKKQTTVFDLLKGMSSDSGALSVKVKDQAAASKLNRAGTAKQVEINQLASAQQNKGSALSSSAIGSRNTGRNVFELETGGKKFSFNVNVNATDSNRTVQEKMAAAINKENTGVTASVVYNEKDKTSSLMLTARDTGEEKAFTLTDKEGDLVEYTGAANTATEARDAVYTVDGEERTSAVNEVDLGDGLTGTLQKTTDKAVEVRAGRDTTEISNSINELVKGFNELRKAAVDFNGDRGAQSLQQRLDTLASAYERSLNRVGVSTDKDGYLQIDQKKLDEAISSNQTEGVFGESSGFTRSLSAVAETAKNNPDRYASFEARRTNTQASNFSYDDYLSRASSKQNNYEMLFSAFA
jgi:flagellar hook-associated protein 2